MKKPTLAVTMGDPSGIGPELVLKVLSKKEAYGYCRPVVIGDPKVMKETCQTIGVDLEIKTIRSISEAEFLFSHLEVLCPEGVDIQRFRWGKLDPAMGKAAGLCLEKAFRLAMEKKVAGVLSAPLNKEAFHLAGYPYQDELAYLEELTHSRETFTIGVMDRVWTVAVTSHIPFREIAGKIKKDRIARTIFLMDQTMRKAGVAHPGIAVAALNVHGGEGGLIGREEIDEIGPAIEEGRRMNIRVEGPFPADTVFLRALAGEFDAVVCMYHDQANIARKLCARRKGATIFMGLPVVCGTTAHGTAFDIAGKGIADAGSMEDAIRYIAMLSS